MGNWITKLLSLGRKEKNPDTLGNVGNSTQQFQSYTEVHVYREGKDTVPSQYPVPVMCCLVGNIVHEHFWGEEKEIKYGLKQLSPNAKVYCFPVLWGDGYENIQVVSRHRKSKKYITLIIKSKHVTNWRMKWIHSPEVIRRFGNRKWQSPVEIQQMITSIEKTEDNSPT